MISLQLRLPEDVRDWVRAQAGRSERSQNAQIVWLLRQHMAANAAQPRDDERPRLDN